VTLVAFDYYGEVSFLPRFHKAPWSILKRDRNQSSYMRSLGLNFSGFQRLIRRYKQLRPQKKRLGLTLLRLNSCMRQKHLCMTFGATKGAISYTLTRGLSCLILSLRSPEKSQICWPDEVGKARFASIVRRCDLIQECFYSPDGPGVDGLKAFPGSCLERTPHLYGEQASRPGGMDVRR